MRSGNVRINLKFQRDLTHKWFSSLQRVLTYIATILAPGGLFISWKEMSFLLADKVYFKMNIFAQLHYGTRQLEFQIGWIQSYRSVTFVHTKTFVFNSALWLLLRTKTLISSSRITTKLWGQNLSSAWSTVFGQIEHAMYIFQINMARYKQSVKIIAAKTVLAVKSSEKLLHVWLKCRYDSTSWNP